MKKMKNNLLKSQESWQAGQDGWGPTPLTVELCGHLALLYGLISSNEVTRARLRSVQLLSGPVTAHNGKPLGLFCPSCDQALSSYSHDAPFNFSFDLESSPPIPKQTRVCCYNQRSLAAQRPRSWVQTPKRCL